MSQPEGKKEARGSGLGARARGEKKEKTAQLAHCVHCHALLGELHDGGCLYARPPRATDLVTEADCEGKGVVHTNASLGLLEKVPKPRRPRMSAPLDEARQAELVQHAIELVEDGHREGGEMFELLDEVDRLSGDPPRSKRIAKERGWNRRGGS